MRIIQLSLNSDWKVLSKTTIQEALEQNDAVYIVSKKSFEREVRCNPGIRCHADRHPDKTLVQCLIPKHKKRRGGVEAIYADFSGTGRILQSVQSLLEAAERKDYPFAMIVGIPDAYFEEMLESRGESVEPQEEEQPEDMPFSGKALKMLKEAAQEFRGQSPEAHRVRVQLVEAAASELPVLLLGETGTGKEVAARFIHEHGRFQKRFIVVNCGAIPHNLVEKELFGHEAYVFTGAGPKPQPGLWEVADGGSLFLDEIGELPLDAQVKVLRVLENKSLRRVGGTRDIPVNPRIIAATHRDLFQMVENGSFREDLFYRLRLFVIRTPAITEDKEQLELEIADFWDDVTKGKGPILSRQILGLLVRRSWVGNYRDLKNFLRALWDHWRQCDSKEVLPVHVKTIEERYGPSPKTPRDGAAGTVDAEVRRMRYLQHHAMCAEALRALQLALAPLTKRGGTIPDDLEIRLRNGAAELTMLLSKPHRFYDAQTFHAIDDARNAMEELIEALPKGEVRIRTLAKRGTLVKINAGLDVTFRGSC